jgi:hypothetical protein
MNRSVMGYATSVVSTHYDVFAQMNIGWQPPEAPSDRWYVPEAVFAIALSFALFTSADLSAINPVDSSSYDFVRGCAPYVVLQHLAASLVRACCCASVRDFQ